MTQPETKVTSGIPPSLIEIGASFAQTYQPVLNVADWKVAMLRHFDVVAPGSIRRVERHRNTDEVFILTVGRADLIVCEGGDKPTYCHIVPLDPNVAYNVKRSVWHHVVLSSDAHIILFERSATGSETTDYAELSSDDVLRITSQLTVG